MYFWTAIRKNRSKYNLTRGINEEDITHILLYDIVVGKDVSKAEAGLLELPGLKKYYNNLQTSREKDDFKRHMRKYISIWLPDCPFEVSTTNRYTITTHEAATTARRFIKGGETIKYLCGNLVAMTPDEEKDMDLTRRDFSVVLSSRKKTPSLFLGPARFSNHDCNANARLVTKGVEGMVIVANQDIKIGDEITVNYGEHYFGKDNCECLCASCEGLERGGWAIRNDEDNSSKDSTPAIGSKAKATSPSTEAKESHLKTEPISNEADDVDKKMPLSVEKEVSNTGLSTPPDSTQKSASQADSKIVWPLGGSVIVENNAPTIKRQSSQPMGRINAVQTISPSKFYGKKRPLKQQSASELNAEFLQPPPSQTQSLIDWMREAGLKSQQRNALSIASVRSGSFHSSASPSDTSSLFDRSPQRCSSKSTTPSAAASTDRAKWPRRPAAFSVSRSPSSSELSSIPSNVDLDDEDFIVPSKTAPSKSKPAKRGRPRKAFHDLSEGTQRKYMRQKVDSIPRKTTLLQQTLSSLSRSKSMPRRPTILPTVELEDASSSSSDGESITPIQRTPGDYIRTRLLLSLNHSRWVDCRTCDTCWVQANGYQTRKECPRCERHSKLYGYRWPKTENAKGESEDRVMDHRTVHRFIAPEEEKEERKRGRGVYKLDVVAVVDADGSSRGVSLVAAEDEDEDAAAKRARRTRGSRLAYT